LYTCPDEANYIYPGFYRGLSAPPGGNCTLVQQSPVFYTPTKTDKTAVTVYEYWDLTTHSFTYSTDPNLNFTKNYGRAFSAYLNKSNTDSLTLPVYRKRRCVTLKNSVHRCEGFLSLTPQSHATCDEYDYAQSKNASGQITALAASSLKAVAAQAQYNPVCKLHSPCAGWGANLGEQGSIALPIAQLTYQNSPRSWNGFAEPAEVVFVPFQDPGAVVCKIPDSGGGGEIDLCSVSALDSDYTSFVDNKLRSNVVLNGYYKSSFASALEVFSGTGGPGMCGGDYCGMSLVSLAQFTTVNYKGVHTYECT
jgi:hypothetical protein